MKRIFFVTLILIAFNARAQFPANHPELLLNKEVKVLARPEILRKYGYDNFHKNDKMKIMDRPINHNKLVDKIFKVVGVSPYEKKYRGKYYKVKLESSESGTIYYDYDPKHEFDFCLEVIGGLQLPDGVYCDDLDNKTDKFTGEITVSSPYSEGVSFLKVVKDGIPKYYMSMNQIGLTLKVGATGLILLLTNGKRLEKPNATIDVKINTGYTGANGYVYNAFIRLTPEDITLLTQNQITDKRLYIYDGTIKNGQKLSEYLKCLSKS